MTSAVMAVVAVVGACWCATVRAQAPLPSSLVSARTVYVTSSGIDRRWLDRFVAAVKKEKRFTVVASNTDADVVMTLGRGAGATVAVPIAGVGVIAADNDAFHLVVTERATGTVLWDDAREAGLTIGGAVDALSKRLHAQLRAAP